MEKYSTYYKSSKDISQPNVIVIFMDDLDYGDLASYGGFPYHAPNITQLA